MNEIELKRDRSEELEDGVSKPYLHHDEEQEAYEAEDPGELKSQAVELIKIFGILTRDLAPVGILH